MKRIPLLLLLLLALPCVGRVGQTQTVIAQSEAAGTGTTLNLDMGPVVASSDHQAAITGLVTGSTITATGGSSTTITSATTANVGQYVVFGASTSTTALQNVAAWVTAVSGSGPYTLTVRVATTGANLPASPANGDTYALSNMAVFISKNGGSWTVPYGALSEAGRGWYTVAGNPTDTNTFGQLKLGWTVYGSTAGDANEYKTAFIAAYNPLAATNLGLSSLPTASPNAAGGLHTIGTGAGQFTPDGTGGVPVSFSQTLPTTPTTNTTGQALFYAAQQIGRMGTAQGGTTTTITLDAGASAVDNIYASHEVKVYSGTGAGQFATIVSYAGSTKVATITRPGGGVWTTTPDSTSLFMILPVPYTTVQSNLDKSAYGVSGTVAANVTQISGTNVAAGRGLPAIDTNGYVALLASEHTEIAADMKDGAAGSAPGTSAAGSIYDNQNVFLTRLTATRAGYLDASIAGIPGAVFGTTAASYNTAGTFGAKLNSAGGASDPLGNLTSGYTVSGTIGKLLVDNLNATISSRQASGNVTVGGYASGQDPATLVLTANTGNGMTVAQALQNSVKNLKYYQPAKNTVAHTQVVIYFVPGTSDAAAAAGTGTPLYTATIHYATDNSTLLYVTYN